MWCHIQEEQRRQLHCCESLKICVNLVVIFIEHLTGFGHKLAKTLTVTVATQDLQESAVVRITILSIHQQMLPVLLWVLSDQHLNTVVRNVLPAHECMCHSHYGQRLVVDMCSAHKQNISSLDNT